MNTDAAVIDTHRPCMPTMGFGFDATYVFDRIGGAISVLEHFSSETPSAFVSVPPRRQRRFTLDELLRGATEENMNELHAGTAFVQDGGPIGRELA